MFRYVSCAIVLGILLAAAGCAPYTPLARLPGGGERQGRYEQLVIDVPPEKMYTDGSLRQDAEIRLRDLVDQARRNRGTVDVNFPLGTPGAVVEQLLGLGVGIKKERALRNFQIVVRKPVS